MTLPKEEADALRRCLALLAPLHSVDERRTMAFNIERRISGQGAALLAFKFTQLAFLCSPNDPELASKLVEQMQTAADAGKLVTRIPPIEKGAFISDLAAWADCPPIPEQSPLRYWLSFITVPTEVNEQIAPKAATGIDVSLLATRDQLIEAFGKFTYISADWFSHLKDTPKLLAARKVKGSRRGLVQPLFCPYEVMQWLLDPKRKKGKPCGDLSAWKAFESHFPKVYNQYSIGDPTES
jgi:hypothetical protein